MGTINTAFKAEWIFPQNPLFIGESPQVKPFGPFHFPENLERRLTHTFRTHDLGIVAHDNHGPHRLLDMGNPLKKQGPQNPTALVAVNGVAVFLFCQKAETTKTVRTFYPTHRERRRADELSMDGYLPISWLVWQPIGAQSGDMPPPITSCKSYRSRSGACGPWRDDGSEQRDPNGLPYGCGNHAYWRAYDCEAGMFFSL